MKLVNIQIALFFANKIERPDLFANRVNSRLNNLFDAMPQILNLPDDAPDEIPLVQMHSTQQDNQFNVSKSRCDFILSPELLSQTSLKATGTNSEGIIYDFLKSAVEDASIMRMGVIFTAFLENQDASNYIVDKYYFNKIPCKEASIRTNVCDKVEGLELNNILEVSNGNLANEQLGINQNGVVIRRDINNIPQEGQILTLKNLKSIWQKALMYCSDKKIGEIK